MSGSLSSAHTLVTAGAPPQLRHRLDALPRTLHVSNRDAGWDDFTKLEPMVALPRMVGRDAALLAHQLGGFWGLTRDRVADGQAGGPLRTELRVLRTRWTSALTDLIGPARASAVVTRSSQLFVRGHRHERALLSARRGDLTRYARALHLRTAWFNATTLAVTPRRQRATLEHGLQWLMLSLQFVDDLVDAADDTRARGVSFPQALGVTTDTFAAWAVVAARRAATIFPARSKLARWSTARAADVRRFFRPTLTPELERALAVVSPEAYWS